MGTDATSQHHVSPHRRSRPPGRSGLASARGGKALALLALALILALGGVACSGGSSEADDGAATEKPRQDRNGGDEADEDGEERVEQAVPVEVTELGSGPIEAVLRYSTNLEAEDQVGVYSQAARQIQRMSVEEGDHVRKGQVLIRLQDEEQRTRVAKVRSQLDRTRREHERQQRLYDDQLISEQAFNDATYEMEQLELELSDAQRELGYTDVKAPISGTITKRYVSVGDQVTMNQHLFDMVDFDSIVARVYVPEKELGRLRVGQAARVTSPALGGAYRGSIERLSPVVDPGSGTVKVTVDVPRQEGLRPGMYVDVQLVTATHEDALLVPKRAVVYDDDQLFVYRMDTQKGVAERVYIQADLEDESWIEPNQGSGLAVGDRIVVAGQAGLKDGAKVRLAGEKPPVEESADAEAEE